jgi:Flp pilus assembly protein TadG
VTVEFAVVATVFFAMVLGIIEMGRGLMVAQLLTSAARVGCRVGIIEGKSTSAITGVATSYLSNLGINGDTATVQVNDGSADASTAQANDEITVIVTVPVTSITWVPGGIFPFGTLSGQYTMRRE